MQFSVEAKTVRSGTFKRNLGQSTLIDVDGEEFEKSNKICRKCHTKLDGGDSMSGAEEDILLHA